MKPPYLSPHPASSAHHQPHAPRRPEHPHISRPSAARVGSVQSRLARFLGRNWARVGYAYHVEPTWLEVNRHDLLVRDLPAPFRGLKIAHLTDFHCGQHIPTGYLEDALARTAAEKPDVIALTGDFVHKGYRHVSLAGKLFRHLKAPLGVYAVLGNHDFSVRNALGIRRYPGLHRAVADALGAEGVKVLRNESVRFDRGGSGLVVAGVDDLWSRESDPGAALAGTCPHTPRVVLAHNPQSVEQLVGHRFDLLLSGHTHGGQVNWPGLGRVLLGKKAKRWAAGLYPHADGHVYVNKGVGFGWRFRFGVRPEVAVFTLKAM
ncbi:MAG: putative metallophosphoesterase [Gemmataceae bacterium]|nr:putative metallophosphoesterase [Gemmataceae bacterium]